MATSERSAPSPARPGDPDLAGQRPSAGATKPVLEVVGGPGRLSADAFRELWAFREVLWAFVVRQVKVRYKQAAVGVAWAVLQPVLAALLFALFLGRYANVPSEGTPYLLLALAGMAGWSYFSTAAGSGSESLVANQGLLRKLYFPRELLPLAAVGAALLDLAIAVAVLVAGVLLYGITPATSWLALPLPLATLVLAGAAFAVGLSALNVYYRDVRHALPFVLQVGLFASAVVYPLSVLPASWRDVYAIANPVAGAIDGIRDVVLHGSWPDWTTTAGSLAWSAVLLVAGYSLFKRLERGFADRV